MIMVKKVIIIIIIIIMKKNTQWKKKLIENNSIEIIKFLDEKKCDLRGVILRIPVCKTEENNSNWFAHNSTNKNIEDNNNSNNNNKNNNNKSNNNFDLDKVLIFDSNKKMNSNHNNYSINNKKRTVEIKIKNNKNKKDEINEEKNEFYYLTISWIFDIIIWIIVDFNSEYSVLFLS